MAVRLRVRGLQHKALAIVVLARPLHRLLQAHQAPQRIALAALRLLRVLASRWVVQVVQILQALHPILVSRLPMVERLLLVALADRGLWERIWEVDHRAALELEPAQR